MDGRNDKGNDEGDDGDAATTMDEGFLFMQDRQVFFLKTDLNSAAYDDRRQSSIFPEDVSDQTRERTAFYGLQARMIFIGHPMACILQLVLHK